MRAAWAALPPPAPTDCPLETWRLRAVQGGRAHLEDADGNTLELARGDVVGGAWTTSAWVPAWRVRRIGPEGLVLESLLDEQPLRRWTVDSPLERPVHAAWEPGAADLAFDREVAARGWSAAPSEAVKEALLAVPEQPLSRVRVSCRGEPGPCLVRADVRSPAELAHALRSLPLDPVLLDLSAVHIELPPARACRAGDEVTMYTALFELGPP